MRYSFGPRLLDHDAAHRERVLPILSAALEAVDPYTAVRGALKLEADQLQVGDSPYNLAEVSRILVVGAGKAGAPMSRAVEDVLGDRLNAGAVNVKRGNAEPT